MGTLPLSSALEALFRFTLDDPPSCTGGEPLKNLLPQASGLQALTQSDSSRAFAHLQSSSLEPKFEELKQTCKTVQKNSHYKSCETSVHKASNIEHSMSFALQSQFETQSSVKERLLKRLKHKTSQLKPYFTFKIKCQDPAAWNSSQSLWHLQNTVGCNTVLFSCAHRANLHTLAGSPRSLQRSHLFSFQWTHQLLVP